MPGTSLGSSYLQLATLCPIFVDLQIVTLDLDNRVTTLEDNEGSGGNSCK